MLTLAGIVSHSAADAGYVLVIPLGGVIFYAAGRHPLAGIAAAFAGVSGGFSANFLVSGIDPLLAGFTQPAAQIIDANYSVNPLSNLAFTAASSVLVILVVWFITDRVIEPRLKDTEVDGDPADMPKMQEVTAADRRGLLASGATLLALTVALAAVCLPEASLLRSPLSGKLTDIDAPLMRSIVPLIFFFFLLPGVVHGYVSGTVKSHRDIIKGMSNSMSTMGYYIVMAFFAAQFIAAFTQSNVGLLVAVKGANFLRDLGLPGQVTVVGIILLSASVNLLVGSASAKWALLSSIFVPMLMELGISPELTQAAYRVGDSTTKHHHAAHALLPAGRRLLPALREEHRNRHRRFADAPLRGCAPRNVDRVPAPLLGNWTPLGVQGGYVYPPV